VRVSTVFLGLDHGFGFATEHGPVLFETMVFGGRLDGHMERSRTREDALHTHEYVKDLVKRAEVPHANVTEDDSEYLH
jgi:hypothetical protein